MGVLSRILGRGGTVDNFLGVGVGSFYTADNVGGQGFSFLFRKSTPSVTGAFGGCYLYHVIRFCSVFITCFALSLTYHRNHLLCYRIAQKAVTRQAVKLHKFMKYICI